MHSYIKKVKTLVPIIIREQDIYVSVKVRDEHPPAHVHVKSPKYSVEIDISGTEPTVVSRSKKRRITTTETFNKRAVQLVSSNLESCQQAWREYHGELR